MAGSRGARTREQMEGIEQGQTYRPDARLRTRRISDDLIDYVVDKIVQGVGARQIILFGSHARGEANADSDLDLLVVHDSNDSNRMVRREIERLLWGRHFGLDLIVRRPEEIERNVADSNPFYTRHLLAEGLILYERPIETSR